MPPIIWCESKIWLIIINLQLKAICGAATLNSSKSTLTTPLRTITAMIRWLYLQESECVCPIFPFSCTITSYPKDIIHSCWMFLYCAEYYGYNQKKVSSNNNEIHHKNLVSTYCKLVLLLVLLKTGKSERTRQKTKHHERAGYNFNVVVLCSLLVIFNWRTTNENNSNK